jgi:hypothetical protein
MLAQRLAMNALARTAGHCCRDSVPRVRQAMLVALAGACLCLALRSLAEGTWYPVSTSPAEGIETMLLLPDGTVMAHSGGGTHWYSLTPDSTGGYTNGTWTSRPAAPYNRLYYASDILKDGRVFVAGGEYGNGTTNANIYDPVSGVWSTLSIPNGFINKNNTVNPPPYNNNTGGFIDAGSELLDNGKVLILPVGEYSYGETVTYDPVSNTWASATLHVGANEDEACTVKLPDGSVLVVDKGSTTSERYIPASNTWVADATCPVALYDPYGGEQGPAFLLPNGNVFFIGSTHNTAIYTPSGTTSPGTWVSGPSMGSLGAPDAPGAMMFNGKILCALSPAPFQLNGTNDVFTTPTYFFEYDYSSGPVGSFIQIHAPGGGFTRNEVTYNDRMLDLPDGTVLFTDGDTQLYIYKPDGSPLVAGKPSVYSITPNANGTVHLTGVGFNGISEGANYGDDAQMSSDYPLVRLTDSGGIVTYARTFNWSSTLVANPAVVSTEFDASTINPGNYSLQVVANGIASDPISYSGPVWVDFNFSFFLNLGTYDIPDRTLAAGVSQVTSGGTINIKSSNSTETMTITKAMTINSVGGPSTIGIGH